MSVTKASYYYLHPYVMIGDTRSARNIIQLIPSDPAFKSRDRHLVTAITDLCIDCLFFSGGSGATPGTLWVWAPGRPEPPPGEVWRGPTTLWVPPPHLPSEGIRCLCRD